MLVVSSNFNKNENIFFSKNVGNVIFNGEYYDVEVDFFISWYFVFYLIPKKYIFLVFEKSPNFFCWIDYACNGLMLCEEIILKFVVVVIICLQL